MLYLVLLWLKWRFGDSGHDDGCSAKADTRKDEADTREDVSLKQTQVRGSFVEVDSWEDVIFRKNINMTTDSGARGHALLRLVPLCSSLLVMTL